MLATLFSLAVIIGSSQEVQVSPTQVHYEHAPAEEGNLPLDSKDKHPVLIGSVTTEMILRHRSEFYDVYEKVQISPELTEQWKTIETPYTIAVVFGSWCEDSHRWLPDLIRLAETPNPYISVCWIGVSRNKTTKKSAWPPQSIRQKIKKVPTIWLFTQVPGGKTKLVGSIVENPPRTDQTMAEALVELMRRNYLL
ncbi:MAG: thioredoxin family protein [Holophagales bacterium]|jgi:hypothetical protein|nr:thioredoxin family protein [Holophagales bacterium]